MKKIATLLNLILLCAASLFAQAPEKFTYQAVVRNASNSLVTNAQVGVRVNILLGSASGNALYSETHVTTTNANGLITVNIGGGSVLHGSFAGIDWSDGPYFLKTDIDPNGGNDYTITSTQQLLSVPYALYATEAGNGFSGDYNDLINVPQIPQIPADISAFNNDAGYITMDSLPIVPTAVSAFTNDAGYLTGYTETDPQYNAWNKDYNDLINKPTIPVVPTNVSAFTNDVGYITNAAIPTIPTVPTNVSSFNNDAGYITAAQVPAQVNADWNATAGAAQILNKPTLFSGNYNDLTNKPSLFSGNYNDLTNKPVLFDGNYNSLTNRPNLAAVAISGSYNDLINKPSIPTAVGELANNVGYITLAQVPAQVNADWNATTGAAQILNKPTLFSGSYNDLTNKPIIPTVPTAVSAFTNDAGYLTSYTETDPQFAAWDKDYNDLTNKPVIPTVPTNVSAFTNDAGYITAVDVQQAAGIPTNVSAFTNDAGYITGYTETDPQFAAWGKNYNTLVNKPNLAAVATTGNYADLTNKPTLFDGNYNSLTNKPNLATVATTGNYNDLTNKPIIPTVPTAVSVFTNDAHYITEAQLNALLGALNNTIDSLRNRIGELENGGTPVNPDPVNPDTTITPGTSINMDGLACPGTPTVTDNDGYVYNTVAVGQQCWMKENLRTTSYADGVQIPLGSSASSTNRYRYYPGGNQSNLNTYGYVYNWPAIMYGSTSSNASPSNVQGICPAGWHVPSYQEWTQLITYVSSQADNRSGDNEQNVAKALAFTPSTTTNYWVSNSINYAVGDYAPNNNNTGFSALPAGDNTGNVGSYANFWTCFGPGTTAYAIQLSSVLPNVVSIPDAAKSNGYSVRCVRNTPIEVGDAQMVVTASVGGTTTTTASCGGTVNSGNSLQVIERGVCWSQMPNPNINGAHKSIGSGTGPFTTSIANLLPNTTYYVRAYATTDAGTAYGNTQTFTTQPDASPCGTATITDYDGNPYNTVKIGNQCWLNENLHTTRYADGTVILAGSGTSGAVAYYYTSSYGFLYNWAAVMHGASSSSTNPSNVRGICPLGWHVPSDAEWYQLTDNVGGQSQYICDDNSSYIARSLAAQTGWNSSTNTCAPGNGPSSNNNATGFGALPAGSYSGNYNGSGYYAYFWSSSQGESAPFGASGRELNYNSANVTRTNNYKNNGCSVRCLRD